MRWRWGPGPVFVYECAIAARRWQTYAMRTLAAALPCIGLVLVWWGQLDDQSLTIRGLAKTGQWFFFTLVSIQLTLVLLAAPAYTAGSICLDKTRGTLMHLLATDLSNTEVVLGKLAARLLPVLGLVFAAAPVLFGAVLLGGIAPEAALGAFVVMLGVAILGSSLALTLSVWLRKTHEVLLLVYLLIIVSLLLLPIWYALSSSGMTPPPPGWMEMSNPYLLAFEPYLRPGKWCLDTQTEYLGIAVAVSAVLVVLAVLRVRAVTIRQGGRPQRTRQRGRRLWPSLLRWLPGPSLDGNPILWREWHRRRLSFWSGLAWALYWGLTIFFSFLAISGYFDPLNRQRELPAVVNAFQVPTGLLLLILTAVTSLSEERVRGSLDVLLTTPLSALQILLGKWWGTYRTALLLVLLPGLIAYAAACSAGNTYALFGAHLLVALVLAYAAAITSLGLALATWISRQGRALAWAVASLALLIIVPFLLLAFVRTGRMEEGLASVSPFFGMGILTDMIGRGFGTRFGTDQLFVWDTFWLGVYLTAAVVLFYFTWATFNISLGRIDNRFTGIQGPFRRDPHESADIGAGGRAQTDLLR